jgi:hypothetical protein
MAFTVTILKETVFGDQRVVQGKYVNDGGSEGGDISTGLVMVEMVALQPAGTAVATNQSVVNETLPLAGGAVTIVTDANQTGYFEIKGY